MQARVKENYPWRNAQACAGQRFTKDEWRAVPAGLEGEACRTSFLEVREGAPVVEADSPPEEEPVQVAQTVAPVETPRRRTRK